MKVIVAIDQTEYARQILDAVIARRWPADTTFRILTVLEPLHWERVVSSEWNKLSLELAAARRRKADEVLSEARKKVQKALADCPVHVELREGSAREEIVTAAVEWMADKIVLGAHGRAPNRLLRATVAGSVAKHAPCTVELVRLKEIAEAASRPAVAASQADSSSCASKSPS